ncbi:M13 family metallopeptidase [Ereboglobus luteus]|uniref:Peptidase M13 n=1 Tax=Ereboglobus luteus TaxID=1796921 RepID=A0A2U8E064_9BACT|nr:M13 family metallopeptidase [Ereboglobus luteus]AWI08229.1 hypothetical protein CKA38_02175 [Ereboglobus luteus]
MRNHIIRALPLLAASFIFTLALRAELDLNAIDSSVRPQDDFFEYANGSWLKTVEIPGDQLGWGSFYELIDRTQKNLHEICENAAAASAKAGSPARMVGDFYASGMNEGAINAAGVKPIQPQLDLIAGIKSRADVIKVIAALKQIGVRNSFGFYVDADEKDSESYLAQVTQGGLGLPDRDYYFTDSEKMKKLRAEYVEHIAKMLVFAGDSPETARVAAQAVMNLETKLAAASRTRVQLRDPEANYNKTAVADLAKITGDFDWAAFFKAIGARNVRSVNVGQPDFMRAFAAQLNETPLADWRAYLRWNLVRGAAPCLGDDFVNENFAFYGRALNGQKEIKVRWKRVTESVDDGIGDALGQLYVAKYFPPASKARVLKLVEDLRSAFRARIETLEWMDAPTRARALEKLNSFSVKMGYPDKWRDYSTLTISRDASYVENVFAANAYEMRRNLAKIGQPVDRTEWFMTASTINAYYNPVENCIVFPAGILQPPFFDANADDAVNYGGIGSVIGHEMTHGFDDQGRQYDARGNLKDWWTPQSTEAFNKRAAVIIDQFNNYTVLDGALHVNGTLTQGENIADLGGVKIAYAALQRALAGQSRAKIGGYTPEQRFFLSYASIWREVRRPEYRRNLIVIDPHSPAEWRVRGPLSNLEEFWKAFDVKEGDKMRRGGSDIVTIW